MKLVPCILAAGLALAACGGGGAAEFTGIWFDQSGRAADQKVLSVVEGCDPDVVFLYLGWPVGTPGKFEDGSLRQFIRDPEARHIAQDQLLATFDADSSLPPDATSRDFQHKEWEMWISPSDENSVYVVRGNQIERWPRVDGVIGCG